MKRSPNLLDHHEGTTDTKKKETEFEQEETKGTELLSKLMLSLFSLFAPVQLP
jgi:hypothetical protein